MDDSVGAFLPDGRFEVAGAGGGPLAGLAFAAKDIIDVAGRLTGCGNPDWAASHPAAAAHAPVVQALLDAGASLAGKTITDELAYSLNGQNFHYGTPANVNAPGRIPGGSSCGSAAAVAAGLVDFALGSDTGGSVRVPAAYCGLFGLRPSHGRISLAGVMPLAPSFDTLGWFARDAALLRRVGEVLLPDRAGGTSETPGSLMVAADAFDLMAPAARARLESWIARLEARLGAARRVELGEPGGGLAAWMRRFRVIQGREITLQHQAWIAERRPRFGPEVAARFAWATGIEEAEAVAASRLRAEFAARLSALLAGDALLCLPTAPDIAPRLDAEAEALVEHRERVLSLTSPAGLAGLPQVTLPVAEAAGCPLGLSLIAGPDGDRGLLDFAVALCGDQAWPSAAL
ncbi:MAG: amidase [Kiloniellales bacterium]|nr:amidase [Kiloniellales bacterium]